ncbi:uncharacterized protein DEA37_0008619 [Paragonimus westermani]|uniref:Uncharacterized protein n=1 Tax=Paragonimus westermani TaxID=34504 RepID=A0A5J4NXU6_9TREM|nr:uncharacterized protein DEA37_0008619 [Paragonimus westermani]
MLTNWQVGLTIGHVGVFLQIAFLGYITTVPSSETKLRQQFYGTVW